ncbi:MAG: thiolase family protein [Lautropia sp.]
MSRVACIPYGAYWSSPFAKWQGSLSHLHSLEFAAWQGRRELAARRLEGVAIDFGVLGTTVPQRGAFYGLPWLTGMMGFEQVAGPTVAQACATSARTIALAADAIAASSADCVFLMTADRVSNGPTLYHPDPAGPGGNGTTEAWVMDNFGRDPFARLSMLQTAENVARQEAISLAEQHDVALMRSAQYAAALADDRAFQQRFMQLPFEVPDGKFRKIRAALAGDEGIHPTTVAGLARLEPVLPGGTVTYGAQTHPADGHAAMFVTSAERATELSSRPEIRIRILGIGQGRVAKGLMPLAPVPAAQEALRRAGLPVSAITHVKTHNPFALGDIVLSRALEFPLEKMNGYGCSLIWGHPQGPTGMRAVIELIEQMVVEGGGVGLFAGCAAGDSAMAVLLSVEDGAGA